MDLVLFRVCVRGREGRGEERREGGRREGKKEGREGGGKEDTCHKQLEMHHVIIIARFFLNIIYCQVG